MHPSPAFFVSASWILNRGRLIAASFMLRPMYTNLCLSRKEGENERKSEEL